jgi:hypothetical protein
MKAIKITAANQEMLMARYQSEDPEMFPIGYVLITHFGDNGDCMHDGVITQELFDQTFETTGNLENGFVAIVRI